MEPTRLSIQAASRYTKTVEMPAFFPPGDRR